MTPNKQGRSLNWRIIGVAMAACLLLGSCTLPRANQKPDLGGTAKKPEMPEKVLVRDDSDAVVNVHLGEDLLTPTALETSDPLPDVFVDNFSAVNATAVEAFRLLMMDKGIAVSADDTANDVRVNITNYSGNLQDVTERISETAGVFYTYRKGLLRLSKDRSFIVPLPPVSEALDEMAGIIGSLGATDAKLDKSSRMITFRATRKVFDSVAAYLERLRKQKVMVVYETYFLEVTLNDKKSTGINWNPINKIVGSNTTGGTTTNSNLSPQEIDTVNSVIRGDSAFGNGTPALNIVDSGTGMAFGTLFTSGSLNINTLFTFLSEQGNVETLSKPTITMISGSKSKFEVGRKIRFVSRRGQNFNNDGNQTSTSFETEDLSTGLKVELLGDYSDDTIYTTINLSLDDLIGFEDPAPGTQNSIQLPETATRSLSTSVRVRPGDAILIAGINQTRDARSNSGPFSFEKFMPFLRSREESVDRSELVIVLKPRIVSFARVQAKAEPAAKPATPADAANAPLVPPTGALAANDPNINSQMIFQPNGAASAMPIVPPMAVQETAPPPTAEPRSNPNAMPLQPPVNDGPPAARSKPMTEWSRSYSAPESAPALTPPVSEPMLSYPAISKPVSNLGMGKDTYSKDRTRLPRPKNESMLDSGAQSYPLQTQMSAPMPSVTDRAPPPMMPPPAPVPPTLAPDSGSPSADPMADSFGYYGPGGTRQ